MVSHVSKYTAVICLTFSSMVLILAQPTIVDEMIETLKNCSFPPPEALKNSSQGGIFSPCVVIKPSLTRGRPSANDLDFAFGKYLCMELFDLSLQLCSISVSKGAFPTSEEDIYKISVNYNVTSFCERLQFSNSRAKLTMPWSNIAVDVLTKKNLCESYCFVHGRLNPVCGAIAWASNLLIADGQKVTEVKTESQVIVAGVQPGVERGTSPSREKPADVPNTKEETSVKGSNNSVTESKLLPSKSDENMKQQFNAEISKETEISVRGQSIPKHSSIVSPTQMATAVSSHNPVTQDGVVINNLEKSEDHEEDHNVPPKVEFHDAPGGDDGRMVQDDLLDNMTPKEGSQDIPDEGLPEDDSHTRGNSDDGRMAPDDLLDNMPVKEVSRDNNPDEVANNPPMERGFQDAFVDAQDSHFFAYFLTMVVICIVGYLLFHNKQKIIALALEGRRMQGSRRRPNTSSYKKLDSNVEEAVTSSCSSSSVTHVIF